jgi:hypothetical protein
MEGEMEQSKPRRLCPHLRIVEVDFLKPDRQSEGAKKEEKPNPRAEETGDWE